MKITWIIEDELLEWYRLSAEERWCESQKLWSFYLLSGGVLDAEPDSESPFDILYTQGTGTPHGRPGMRSVWRGRIQP